jgi:hypothetical protein
MLMLMPMLHYQVGSMLGAAIERGGREGALNVLKGGAGGGTLEGEMEAMLSCIREVYIYILHICILIYTYTHFNVVHLM